MISQQECLHVIDKPLEINLLWFNGQVKVRWTFPIPLNGPVVPDEHKIAATSLIPSTSTGLNLNLKLFIAKLYQNFN